MVRAELQPARKAAEELLALGERSRMPSIGWKVTEQSASCVISPVNCPPPESTCRAGINLYDSEEHRSHILRYELDPGQTSLCYAARALWVLGHPDQAVIK